MKFRYVSLSKRPLTGSKNKLKSFIPSFIPSSRKYSNCFHSPSRDEELLLVKKKFIKLSKNGKSTSSFLSFISSINNLYLNTKKHENNVFNKTSKNNQIILTSMDNSSIVNSKDKILSYNSNNNSNNLSVNKSRKKSKKKSKKKTPESKYSNTKRIFKNSFSITGGNDNSKHKNKMNSKTTLNSRKNSKEKDNKKGEIIKGYKNSNKDKILIKKLNEIQIINTAKPNCNSYRTSGGATMLTKGRPNPFSNKNILDSILSRLEKPKTSKINNNLNIMNIFDDYLKKSKIIKNNQTSKNKNINNFNYSNISNKKLKSPVNKNLSMNFNVPNLNYNNNNQSNTNNKISKTAKVSPREQLINFNSIYSKNSKTKSKGKNSSYSSTKEVHSSSWRNAIKNNCGLNLKKYKNNSNNINNLNIIQHKSQNSKYASTYYKTNKLKNQKSSSDNKQYILNNNTNNVINTINTNSNNSEINGNINNNGNCMSNTYNLFHNAGGTMYNSYNININNQINNHVSYQNDCFNNECVNNNIKKKDNIKNKQISQNQKEILHFSKKINGKNNTANNSPNKNMTFKISANNNNNGYINISIGKNISSNKNQKKNSMKKKNINQKSKEVEKTEKNKSEDKIKKINNEQNISKYANNNKSYFDKCNNSDDKIKEENICQEEINIKDNQSINNNSNIHDNAYYMRLSQKLSTYITNYYNKFKKYPDTSLSFYKYGRLIGQGAFGKVNLGLNILTGRVVAIKSFIKKNLEANGENMRKILYETNLMKKLNHPNITKILEMFEDKKYILIIMEYINGGNLFSFVKKRRKLSEKTAKFLFKQIIEGIKHIHQHNIVHRDIKLENILIDINNNIKICDFGIGKILSSDKELLYDQCGTPMYMAPEIFLSSKKNGYEGPPVDIWSSGIALYIMLSGTLPFDINKKIFKNKENNLNDSLTSDEIQKNHNFHLQQIIINNEPKKIPKISREAKNLLHGLLNKDPQKRLTIEEILNHPWLNETLNKKQYSKIHHHLFTKAELLIMSKTYIDYRKAKNEDLIENFTISNLIKDESNKKNNKNITTKSSILAPYNTLIQNEENNSFFDDENADIFDDFNNKKIKLENNDLIGFNAKSKEFNMLYELNNNGEVDNGMLINSKTNSVSSSYILNNSKNSYISRTLIKDSDNEDDEEINIKDIIENEEKLEKKKENVYNQMKLMGYEKEYVIKCVDENILSRASVVYFLLMNYD